MGAGIKPSSLVQDKPLRMAIQLAWAAWTDECDAEDVTDFYGLTRRIAREAFLAGECFVRFRPRLPQDGLDVPLQLQLLPTEQLPMWRLETVPDGLTMPAARSAWASSSIATCATGAWPIGSCERTPPTSR